MDNRDKDFGFDDMGLCGFTDAEKALEERINSDEPDVIIKHGRTKPIKRRKKRNKKHHK